MNQQTSFQVAVTAVEQVGIGGQARPPSEPVFSQVQIEAFRALPFLRPAAQRLLDNRADLEDPFHARLLSISYQSAVPYSQIMEEYNGNPSWIEFKHRKQERWAFVLPDLYKEGRFRVQFFDADGMIRHHGANSLAEAVEMMVRDGHVLKDQGRADVLCATNRWKRGTELAGLIYKLNSSQITLEEFEERERSVCEQYPC